MSSADSLLTELGLDQLTRDARLRLVHELVDSLADRGERGTDVPAPLKLELRKRIDECNRSPDGKVQWAEFKKRMAEGPND